MIRSRALMTFFFGLGLSGASMGQTWQLGAYDSGALIRAEVSYPGSAIGFVCTAPSQQGRPLIETGEHESHRTNAYEMVVALSDTLFDWQPPYRIDTVVIQTGPTAFRLPTVQLDELVGSGVTLSMTDPMMLALLDAPSISLNTGQGRAVEFPIDGLSASLVGAMQVCAQRWMDLGVPISSEMNRLLALGIIAPPGAQATQDANVAALPAAGAASARAGIARDADLVPLRRPQPGDGSSITFSPRVQPILGGQSMYDRATATGNATCGGPAIFGEGAFWPGAIDSDGQEDIVMNWGFVECLTAQGTLSAVPGACDTLGQCRVTLFSSVLIGQGLGDVSMNAFHAVPERPGVSVGQVFVSMREGMCGAADRGFGCMAWLRFTGVGYEVLNQTALSADERALTNEIYGQSNAQKALPPGYEPAPQMPIPNAAPPAIDAHLRGLCQGDYVGDETGVQGGDIDGDGVVDFLINWTSVQCQQGSLQGRAFCGAANCRIDLFVSTKGYVNPTELLGIAADFVQDGQGRVGVLLTGTHSICSDGACATPWYWTGTDLAQ